MHILGTIVVRPVLPERINGLQELSRNVWWSWNPKALALFSRLDPAIWQETYHNPVALLSKIDQDKLEAAAKDKDYLADYDQIMAEFHDYMNPESTRFSKLYPQHANKTIAYFSAEFGLHESLPIYSGGLGILSGDHMKTASDMGIPMVGIGLLYNHGYFVQQLNGEGWQEAIYHRIDFSSAPVEKALDKDGHEIIVQIEMSDRNVSARVWQINVGRIKLYLLDTDIDQNALEDRELSAKLYGGDNHMRIAQEKILGIGGVKALRRLGIKPWVWHMNEGHSAFLTIELMREKVAEGLNWREAIEAVTPSVCFTTHTPVPAGQDAFGADLIEQHFWNMRNQLGMSRHEFMRLGQYPDQPDSQFNLTILALRLSRHRNGVSKLHGAVSRQLWQGVWPDMAKAEIPIGHVTNGVHAGTWIAQEMGELFDRHVGTRWRTYPDDKALWNKSSIPDGELWETHQLLKEKMIERVRKQGRKRLTRLCRPAWDIQAVDNWLNPNTLTIGFARRFATYKRAVLLFSDIERLKKIMLAPGREVNFVFAGKAHPADRPGQEFIKRIYEYSLMPEFRNRIVIIEDYDIDVAKHLVTGVDVWLNNPRRPLEASGTSGEKAAMNGVLNFSVLDGWWAEGYNGENGWSIGEEREFSSNEEQDTLDAASLYSTLENEIVPLYYDRGEDNIPHGWTNRMKNCIRTLLPEYSTHRMLHDYDAQLYIPAGEQGLERAADNFDQARQLASWNQYLENSWYEVSLEADFEQVNEVRRDQEISLQVRAYLGKLRPEDVKVELYAGKMFKNDIINPRTVELNYNGFKNGAHCYEGHFVPQITGSFAYAVRAIPVHPSVKNCEVTKFIRWAH